MSILSSPKGTSCGRCGRAPALGYARVNKTWLCHPDEEDLPDCYSLWQQDRASDDISRMAAQNRQRWNVTLTLLEEAEREGK